MAQGLEFMWVQVFACRRSQVILRYVAIAPLESAICFSRQQSTASLSAVGSEKMSADECSLMQKLNSFMAEAEIKIRELCELVKVGAACARTTTRYRPFGIGSPRRDSTPRPCSGNCLRVAVGLQSLCEAVSAAPVGAVECRSCFWDVRNPGRSTDTESVNESVSMASQRDFLW